MKQRLPMTRETAEKLAIQALTFIAQDGERLGRFLAITGISLNEIRAASREPGFLAGGLDARVLAVERHVLAWHRGAVGDIGRSPPARRERGGRPPGRAPARRV